MFIFLRIVLLLPFLLGFKLGALSSAGTSLQKGKIHSIIIGGIRAPGHWLYSSMDKVYGGEDKHVLIINDLSMTNPDVLAGVNNATLPILEKKLACLKGSVTQITFEHVGYGLQKKHFDRVISFLASLLKPGGKIVYTSYRAPFSFSDSEIRQRQEYLAIVPDFCQLLGIPEPKRVYEFKPHQVTSKGYHLQSELKALNQKIHQKIQALLENDSCCDVENEPEILELMKKAKTILDHPNFPSSNKLLAPIESYLPLHNKIINCNSDLPHRIATSDITQEWLSFRIKKSPCSETLTIFENCGLVVQSIEVERTNDVFAFKTIFQKP